MLISEFDLFLGYNDFYLGCGIRLYTKSACCIYNTGAIIKYSYRSCFTARKQISGENFSFVEIHLLSFKQGGVDDI